MKIGRLILLFVAIALPPSVSLSQQGEYPDIGKLMWASKDRQFISDGCPLIYDFTNRRFGCCSYCVQPQQHFGSVVDVGDGGTGLTGIPAADTILASDGYEFWPIPVPQCNTPGDALQFTQTTTTTEPSIECASGYSGSGACTNEVVKGLNAGAAPSCAKVDLTTDVTGVLPTANGGTALSVLPVQPITLASPGWEVDGTYCRKLPNQEIGYLGEPKQTVIVCDNDSRGTIYFPVVVMAKKWAGDDAGNKVLTVEMNSIDSNAPPSGALSFDIHCQCKRLHSKVGEYGDPYNLTMSYVGLHQYDLSTATTANIVPAGSLCAGGDNVWCKAVVNTGNTSGTNEHLAGVYVVSAQIAYQTSSYSE